MSFLRTFYHQSSTFNGMVDNERLMVSHMIYKHKQNDDKTLNVEG